MGIIAAALICAIVTRLAGKNGTNKAMIKLITGLFLAFTVISPLAKLRIADYLDWTGDFSEAAKQAAAEGESETKKAIAQGIKLRTEAYILDKATALNVHLQVEVTLSDAEIPAPKAVRLSGSISPYAKARLQQIISEDLGIDMESQIWT